MNRNLKDGYTRCDRKNKEESRIQELQEKLNKQREQTFKEVNISMLDEYDETVGAGDAGSGAGDAGDAGSGAGDAGDAGSGAGHIHMVNIHGDEYDEYDENTVGIHGDEYVGGAGSGAGHMNMVNIHGDEYDDYDDIHLHVYDTLVKKKKKKQKIIYVSDSDESGE